MKRFQTLLKYDPKLTPHEEQVRASEGLADALNRSHLEQWKRDQSATSHGRCLLLAIAPYSQYDLTLLDILDESLSSQIVNDVKVFVVNLLDYQDQKELEKDFPGIGQIHQTPIAAFWESGELKELALGRKARELVAEAIHVPSEELNQRVSSESPRYEPETSGVA